MRDAADDNPTAWGNLTRYYVAANFNRQTSPPPSRTQSQLEKVLHKFDPELPKRVEHAFKQSDLILRDYLRSEMGLCLSVVNDMLTAPVRLSVAAPESAQTWRQPLVQNDPGAIPGLMQQSYVGDRR
jgi:hypothetical protein